MTLPSEKGLDSSSESSSKSDSKEEAEVATIAIDEIAILAKHQPIKSIWISDTSATSYITDQLELFSSLKPIPRRTIKVSGGKLYSTSIGIAKIVAESGSALLKDILYVPKLGVNLLSGKRVY